MINWHRLFGIGLIDLFAYTNYEVELEKDLSIKQQFLDVVIIEKVRAGELPKDLPDGLDNLAQHNLLTYKSFRESLTAWALDELVGHYVNYRKQISKKDALLPAEQFRLYAVSTFFPETLSKETALVKIQPGVYETKWGSQIIRILVLNQFPETPNNTFWQLYSANPRKIQTAKLNYQHKLAKLGSIINQLFKFYKIEEVIVAYTVEDYVKDYIEDNLDLLNPEKILEKFSTEERLIGLSTQERLTGLSAEEIFQKFSAQERLIGLSTLSIEERLEGLSEEELERYLTKVKKH